MALTRVKGATFTASENFLYTNVRDFGAIGDGVVDDTAAINNAIAALPNGGTVFIPRGTYSVTLSSGSTAILIENKIHIRGEGIGATNIVLANSSDAHVFNVNTKSDWSICELSIDGNRVNQTANVHGIRVSGSTRAFIHNVDIRSVRGYGIGLQGGTIEDMQIDSVFIDDVGRDGIDVKNLNDNNVRNSISNVHIKNFGNVQTVQAGIDLRGPWVLVNVQVTDFGDGHTGVRFRNGEPLDVNGIGAHNSSLTNFYIKAGSITGTRGVISIAREVAISEGYIEGASRGIFIQDQRCKISGVTCTACVEGLFVNDDVPFIGGDLFDTLIDGCVFVANTDEGMDVRGKRTVIDGCAIINNTTQGISITATAADTVVNNNVLNGNTPNVGDGGTNTHASNNVGWATEAFISGAALLWDSTGLKSQAIAHGLDVTPTLDQCRISKVKVTGNNDGAFDWTMVSAVDVTNVTADSIVGTANTLGGAQFQHVVSINARP